MTILFGHPTGNPNSHHAALAHYESDRLEAFCVPWMPSATVLSMLKEVGPLHGAADRLSRRYFSPLASAPKIQGRLGEWGRLLTRLRGHSDEALSYEANDWLMQKMKSECRRVPVTAVHSYEDCSLWQFEEAKRRGKVCIYDMPIGYYPAWERIQSELVRRYVDWLPPSGLPSGRYVRVDQKREEMRLADLILVPSTFVAETIRITHPEKNIALAPYGVDSEFWSPRTVPRVPGPLRFLFAGQLSLRKGTPLLLDAWKLAAPKDAQLELVGHWQLAAGKRTDMPPGVSWSPPCAPSELRERFRGADIFVLPSYFEGFGLVILEAMACGLPVIVSNATAATDVVTEEYGRVVARGSTEELVESFRWFDRHRGSLSTMSQAARKRAEECTWQNYRRAVSTAVEPYV